MLTANGGRPNGFTLLEVLVALAVVGLLFVALGQGTHVGLLAWSSENRLVSSDDDFNVLDHVVRHFIEGADPGDADGPAPLIGSTHRLQCISALPSGDAATPTQRVQAILLVSADHRLVLRWRPYVHAVRIGPPAPLSESELLRGVSRIELAFFRPDRGWVTTWQDPDLPRLVRVRLLFPEGDPRHWPDIIAAPVLDR